MSPQHAALSGPIRVLYVLHNAELGGAGGSLLRLINSFPREAVHAFAAMPDGPIVTRFREAGVDVAIVPHISVLQGIDGLPLRGARFALVARAAWQALRGGALRRVILRARPDIVHVNERGFFHAAWLAKRTGVPVVAHARSVADREVRWLRRLSARWNARLLDRVFAIDESVRRSLDEPPTADVIYNPLGGAVSPSAARPRPAHEPMRVVYLSGLIRAKGVVDLLGAAKALRHCRSIHFTVAGANPRSREYYASTVGRLIGRFGLTDDLEAYLGDFVRREHLEATVHLAGHLVDTSALLSNADVVVFPSHTNGLGRSVYEAGVLGIPAVVSMRDRVEDIVEDGVTGLIVEERNVEALAAAIRRLHDDDALRVRLGTNASEKYTRLFDSSHSASVVLGVYRSLVAPGNACPASGANPNHEGGR